LPALRRHHCTLEILQEIAKVFAPPHVGPSEEAILLVAFYTLNTERKLFDRLFTISVLSHLKIVDDGNIDDFNLEQLKFMVRKGINHPKVASIITRLLYTCCHTDTDGVTKSISELVAKVEIKFFTLDKMKDGSWLYAFAGINTININLLAFNTCMLFESN